MSTVQLTVLFATRNGEHVLPRTLDAYRRAAAPAAPWQLIVVNNGSDDATADILRSFANGLPLQVIEQPVVGKNRALNIGIDAIKGRLTVITDDDAMPSPSFLTAWERYVGFRGDFGLFGGRIEPFFEVPPPQWVAKNKSLFVLMFSERNLPEGAVPPGAIFGCNMAVRTAIFEQGFRFAEDIGPNRDDPYYPMGSETEFCCRVARSGVLSWFAREPHVHHIVRPHQNAERAWIDRAYRCGRGRAQMMSNGEDNTPSAPVVSWKDRLAMISPSRRRRIRGLIAYHLARGFHDEWAKRCAIAAESQRTEVATTAPRA